ncbi:hypothetical protein ACFSKM_16305 [Ancylobacter dichloromethanicus]
MSSVVSLPQSLKQSLTIANRLTETLREVGDDLHAAFNVTLDVHRDAIENLRRDITPEMFRTAVKLMASAKRIVIFRNRTIKRDRNVFLRHSSAGLASTRIV